jgi:hypothetical protein
MLQNITYQTIPIENLGPGVGLRIGRRIWPPKLPRMQTLEVSEYATYSSR